MSNTSSVTPYESSSTASSTVASAGVGVAGGAIIAGAGLAAMCAVGAAKGIISVAQWLNEENEVERRARLLVQEERLREMMMPSQCALSMQLEPLAQSHDRLDSRAKQIAGTVHSVTLSMHGTGSLISAAESLGYKRESLACSVEKPGKADLLVLLVNDAGERLAIERSARGKIVIHTAGGDRRVHRIVRKHTVDRAVEHLKKKGMNVQAKVLGNGEVQLKAQETALNAKSDGRAVVTTNVREDGSALIDVEKIKSGRCKEIARDLADAIGCRFIKSKEKTEAYQLPGEPTFIEGRI